MSVVYLMRSEPGRLDQVERAVCGLLFPLASQSDLVKFGNGFMSWRTNDREPRLQLAFALLCDAIDSPDLAYILCESFADWLGDVATLPVVILPRKDLRDWALRHFGQVVTGYLSIARAELTEEGLNDASS